VGTFVFALRSVPVERFVTILLLLVKSSAERPRPRLKPKLEKVKNRKIEKKYCKIEIT